MFLLIGSLISLSSCECVNESVATGRSYCDESISIHMCSFSRVSMFQGNGGVIYIKNDNMPLYVEYSAFYKASAQNGGAIYFKSNNILLKMICAYECASSSWGLFAFLSVSGESNLGYLSVSKCGEISGYRPIHQELGSQILKSSNTSLNKVIQFSGITSWTSGSIVMEYCTFSNNIVFAFVCLSVDSPNAHVSNMNIIHNNSPGMLAVVHIGGGICNMANSIFYGNTNRLFNSAGVLTISNCIISHDQTSLTDGTISFQGSVSFGTTESFLIPFFGTEHCIADNPIPWETPAYTPFPSTPIPLTDDTASYMWLIIVSGVGVFILVAFAFYYYSMTMKGSSSEDIEQRE